MPVPIYKYLEFNFNNNQLMNGMLARSLLFSVLLILSSGQSQSISTSTVKVLSWNMGSDYCVGSEKFPDCDTYIVDSVNKLIAIGSKYDILCLQGFPKYYRNQQKAIADKLINDFVLKHKYFIFRKEGTDIAILSKIPAYDRSELDLSTKYGAQRIIFSTGPVGAPASNANTFQVVNIHNTWIGDLQTRKKDIRRTISWMTTGNYGGRNILAGDFHMYSADIEAVMKDAIGRVPTRACKANNCIFAFQEKDWPFSYEKISSYVTSVGDAITYTSTLPVFSYNKIRTVAILGNNDCFLAVNGRVFGDDYQRAFFGTISYIRTNPSYSIKFIVEKLDTSLQIISCPFDGVSYLGINKEKSVSDNDYEWAYWYSWKKLPYRRYFNSNSNQLYLQGGYLVPNNPVTSWEWALFAETAYIENNPARYNKQVTLVDI